MLGGSLPIFNIWFQIRGITLHVYKSSNDALTKRPPLSPQILKNNGLNQCWLILAFNINFQFQVRHIFSVIERIWFQIFVYIKKFETINCNLCFFFPKMFVSNFVVSKLVQTSSFRVVGVLILINDWPYFLVGSRPIPTLLFFFFSRCYDTK